MIHNHHKLLLTLPSVCSFVLIYPTYICNCTWVTLTIRWSVMCYPNKVDIIYTPILTQDYLYRLRPSGHSHFRLNSAAWRATCEAGVALHRPTHRGCRGGARKQRPTHVIVSTRPTVALSDTNCVNYDNVTCVSVTTSPSMDHSEPVTRCVTHTEVQITPKLG